MVFVPVSNTCEVVMKYSDNTQQAANVYHVHNAGAWDVTTMTALANLFKTWESGTGSIYRNMNVYLYDIYVRDLTTANSLSFDVPVSPVINGQEGSSPQAPNNVTVAIKAQTGLAGRSFRGRSYWIGLSDNQIGGSFVAAGSLANIVAALNTLRSSVNGVSGHTMVVASKRSGGAPRVAGVTTDITTWLAVDNAIDSQRRRLPFHNVHH